MYLIIGGIDGFISEEEKDQKREHGRNRYHNMSKEKKQKLKNIKKITLKLIRLDFLWYVFNHDLIVYAMI